VKCLRVRLVLLSYFVYLSSLSSSSLCSFFIHLPSPSFGNLLLCFFSYEFPFLGAIAKLQKEIISFAMSVCLSVHLSDRFGTTPLHWTDFHRIWYLSIFKKYVEKIQVPYKKAGRNGGGNSRFPQYANTPKHSLCAWQRTLFINYELQLLNAV